MEINASDQVMLEAGKLAVLASTPAGLGFLHHEPSLTKDDIHLEIVNDHNPGLFIDYYQGRMVKFRAWKKGPNLWQLPDSASTEYESWLETYEGYRELVLAAARGLGETLAVAHDDEMDA